MAYSGIQFVFFINFATILSNSKMNKKCFFQMAVTGMMAMLAFTSCHHETLEDRAEKEAYDYTKRYCPTPIKDFQHTDSVTFTRQNRTFNYYNVLSGKADQTQLIDKLRPKLRAALLDELIDNTGSQVYKEAGFCFHYIFRSAKTGKILYEESFTHKDYRTKMHPTD